MKRKNLILKDIMMHDYFLVVPKYLLREEKFSMTHASEKKMKPTIPAIGTLKLMF